MDEHAVPVTEEPTSGSRPLFPFGRTVATPGALRALVANGTNGAELLARHARGDWGDLSEADRHENDFSVSRRLRILSAYRLPDGTKLWIITEADRSATTFLLPDEY
jgi:hypothetical protein